ncbi:MAG: peroxiredoxin family protein [Leptolinea sp.]|nr:peroxiredoxin family protein [Leptolinea sp.]
MAQLRQDYQQYIERDAVILILGPDGQAAFKRVWDIEKMPMPGLSDPGSKVADRYMQEVNLLKLGRMPALLIIDRHGNIRFIHYGKSMADIPGNETILRNLDEINAIPVEGK